MSRFKKTKPTDVFQFPAKKDKKKGTEDDVPVILKGIYMFPNGDRYDGEYVQLEDGSIVRSGAGSHFTADGQHFHGTWVADKMEGQGRMELPSGAFYEGDFVNNQYHGIGKYTWPNGSFYDGQFVENR